MTLRKAYQDMVKVHGIADTATLMDMTESSIDNRIYERKDQCFTVRQALRLQQISNTTKFAEAIAEAAGGTFIRLPEFEDGNDEILKQSMRLHAEIGDLYKSYEAALANDEQIDRHEKAELNAIKDKLLVTLPRLVGLMFKIHCAPGV